MATTNNGPRKLYSQGDAFYEKKLKTVMMNFGISKYEFDYGRYSAYVQFVYKGVPRRFEQTVERMRAEGIKIYFGSDIFASIVLSLEDLYRMDRKGIYHLDDSIKGVPMLAAPVSIPDCFKTLGFTEYPTMEQLKARWKDLAKIAHPDGGGSESYFNLVKNSYDQAIDLITQREV